MEKVVPHISTISGRRDGDSLATWRLAPGRQTHNNADTAFLKPASQAPTTEAGKSSIYHRVHTLLNRRRPALMGATL